MRLAGFNAAGQCVGEGASCLSVSDQDLTSRYGSTKANEAKPDAVGGALWQCTKGLDIANL